MSTPKKEERILRQPHRDYYEIIRQILQNVYAKAFGFLVRPFRTIVVPLLVGALFSRTFLYLRALTNDGLLRISQDTGPDQRYEITPKGLRYLKVFAEIEDDLMPVNDDEEVTS